MTHERKLVLAGIGIAVFLIVFSGFVASSADTNDDRPIVTNAGAQGVKAAFVLLGQLGYKVQRSNDSLTKLDKLDAEHTTLVLASPWAMYGEPEQTALDRFMKRGGHVLADGSAGARVLPGYYWLDDAKVPERCVTTPEGNSAIAQAGPLLFHPYVLAKTDLVETYVAQSCAQGAAVIYYPYGKGSVVWWASQEPLTNRGLHQDANLRLLMASIGTPDRVVVFNETENTFEPSSPWSKTQGIPLTALLAQLLAVLLLLFLAYGLRHGPLRTLATTPRTSPLEFAYSMGSLYHKAGAGEAAVSNARQRFLAMLEQRCGISRETVQEGAEAITEVLRERLNYTNTELIPLLKDTERLQRTPPAAALALVKRFHQVMNELEARISIRTMANTEPTENAGQNRENFFV